MAGYTKAQAVIPEPDTRTFGLPPECAHLIAKLRNQTPDWLQTKDTK